MADYAGGTVASKQAPLSPGDMECTSVDITKSANGGFIAEHRYRSKNRARTGLGDPYIPPKTYTYDSFEKLSAGIKKALG